MSYFIFNNMDSRDMKVIINKTPIRNKPAEKKELIEVPGRRGYLTYNDNSYAPINITIECTLKPEANIDQVILWLNGSGKLILSNDLDRYYSVEIVNNITFEQSFKCWNKFLIEFVSQPFSKSITETIKELIVGINDISITGTADIYPILDIVGNGTYKITINNNQIINLKSIITDIRLDNEFMNAVSIDGLNNLNNKMEGNFFKLKSGENIIKLEVITGDILSVSLKYKEAWL